MDQLVNLLVYAKICFVLRKTIFKIFFFSIFYFVVFVLPPWFILSKQKTKTGSFGVSVRTIT